MPTKVERWKCNRCWQRFGSYSEAFDCEVSHIAQGAAADAIDEFRAAFPSESVNFSPKEPFK